MAYKKCVLTMLTFFAAIIARAGIIQDDTWKHDYATEIKSIGEFISRFNLEESHPDIPLDSLSDKRNICMLFNTGVFFDTKDNSENKERILAFCDSVLANGIKTTLSSGGWFALVKCKIKYREKAKIVDLILVQENLDGYYRWSLFGVSGLVPTDIIKTTKIFNYSPVDHELSFMGLTDIFNENPQRAFGYRFSNNIIDECSVFLTLIQEGLLTISEVTDTEFVCIDVPGFIFKIREEIRNSNNSGWLITELREASIEEKINYINNLSNR